MRLDGFTPFFDYFEDDLITAAVYGKIWRICDWSPKDECTMSNIQIGKQLGGLGERTIRRRKELLEKMKLITIETRKGHTDLIRVNHELIMSMDIESGESGQKVQGTPARKSRHSGQKVRRR